VDLLAGGGSLLLGSRGNFIGPGHAGIVSRNGADWFSCHFYDGTRGGLPTLALLPLRWNTNGWPEVVQERTPLRTGLAPCTKVYLAGGLRTRSLSAILPPMLVNTGSATGLGARVAGPSRFLGLPLPNG
jgi:hypothetical protein